MVFWEMAGVLLISSRTNPGLQIHIMLFQARELDDVSNLY
jgi:hypothetical protein